MWLNVFLFIVSVGWATNAAVELIKPRVRWWAWFINIALFMASGSWLMVRLS